MERYISFKGDTFLRCGCAVRSPVPPNLILAFWWRGVEQTPKTVPWSEAFLLHPQLTMQTDVSVIDSL